MKLLIGQTRADDYIFTEREADYATPAHHITRKKRIERLIRCVPPPSLLGQRFLASYTLKAQPIHHLMTLHAGFAFNNIGKSPQWPTTASPPTLGSPVVRCNDASPSRRLPLLMYRRAGPAPAQGAEAKEEQAFSCAMMLYRDKRRIYQYLQNVPVCTAATYYDACQAKDITLYLSLCSAFDALLFPIIPYHLQ